MIPPPAPVASLSLGRPMPPSPVANMSWRSVTGASRNLYRGQARNLSDLGCFLSGLARTSIFYDGAVAGGGLYVYLYLITTKHCGESGLGASSFAGS